MRPKKRPDGRRHQATFVRPSGAATPRTEPLVAWRLGRTKALLRASIETRISVEDLSAAVGLSPAYFSRAFKAATGLAPIQYLTRLRCAHAQQLLGDCTMPLSDIALAAGFCDQSHFTRAFSRVTGRSPAAWRRGDRVEGIFHDD